LTQSPDATTMHAVIILKGEGNLNIQVRGTQEGI